MRRLSPGIEAHPEAYGHALDAAARAWLAAQGAKRGFRPDQDNLAVGGWEAWSFHRRNAAADDRRIAFDSYVFEGSLTVTHPGKLRECLHGGLGAERAFGFGLMQIRPAA